MRIADDVNRPGGEVFAAGFLIFALFLLSQIAVETAPAKSGNIVAQPRFWPAVGTVTMVTFAIPHLLLQWRSRLPGRLAETRVWLGSVEFCLWFMLYVAAVPVTGYLAATLAFTVLLAIREGYRDRKSIIAAAGIGFAIVFVFKSLLSVRIPGGAVYEYLPSGLRSFMILNL